MRALAVVCVRNESMHVRRCLTDFIADGLDVFLIDNGSTDGSLEVAEDFLGCGLVGISHLKWNGEFSLKDQLRAKQSIIEKSSYDWVVHADADEWLCSPNSGEKLIDGIARAHYSGCNCINFHELVFVPLPCENFYAEDYSQRMLSYYFYQPTYPRLNRAWKKDAGLRMDKTGGHRLEGRDTRIYAVDFHLRHYIALSEEHAKRKYIGRAYSAEDIMSGWHLNRRRIREKDLHVKWMRGIWKLQSPDSRDFNFSMPMDRHFWEWNSVFRFRRSLKDAVAKFP